MKRIVLAAAALSAMVAGGQAQAADCDRACLKTFVDSYFDALAKHDPKGLPLSPKLKATENGEPTKLGDGVWKAAGPTGYRLELYDPTTGNAGVQAVVNEATGPALYVVRLKIEDGKISESETIVARKGSYGNLWNPENLKAPSRSFTLSIRPSERNSRLELLAAADAYWRAFETTGTPDYHRAPLVPTTDRFENGAQTTNASFAGGKPTTAMEQFDSGRFKGAMISERRYPVIDEERGVIMSIVRFGPRPATDTRASDLPLVMEAFAVQAGQIREVQVVLITRPLGSPTGW